MSYEDFEIKMEAKGWIPTPRDVAESLQAAQTGPDTFEVVPSSPSETPIWDSMVSGGYDPLLEAVNIGNHISETTEWATSQLDSMWFAVDYHHHWYNPRRQPLELTT